MRSLLVVLCAIISAVAFQLYIPAVLYVQWRCDVGLMISAAATVHQGVLSLPSLRGQLVSSK